ncbi:MAG: hypothetical protein GY800_08885 [Planctomycetes bacterium]|nr:hypothetical protein [Planctomycetota bacterium]
MKKVEAENRDVVRHYFRQNPDALMKDCQEATGLSAVTVRKHVRLLSKKEKR